jgi:adhesin transport system outer membrane protein
MPRILLTLIGLLVTNISLATDITSLRQAVEYAALNNPSVLASWNAFEAADQGRRAAKGGYYPSVDLSAEIGSERTDDTQNIKNNFDSSSTRLTITQMLFDGFATKNEIAKQEFVKLARYYEFKQASEEVALETSQAYLDIQRYTSLVDLARENLIQHRRYHRDIEDRVQSGIGRGVDLEQARARLALAESNLLTETTNLHDVTTRFYRLVGLFPADNLATIDIPKGLIPDIRESALKQAYVNNPQLNAAIENIRASSAELRNRNAPMMPRFDLRFRKQIDENDRGIDGQYDEEAIELVMTYNLYRGGSC